MICARAGNLSSARHDTARAILFALMLAALAVQSRFARAEDIKIGGTGAALGTMQLLAEAHAKSHPGTRIVVLPSLGTGGGLKALLAGAIQIAVSTRDATGNERASGATAVEYGRTPLVFATSVKNKVAGLTLGQLVDIYAGKTERWPDGTPIRIVLRPPSDTDSEVIRMLSPEMRLAKALAEKRPGMLMAVTDQDAADSLERVAGAIGPTSLALILSEKRQLRALKFNDMEPSVKNLAMGDYPLQKSLFLVTGAKSPPAAQAFVAFVRSPAGRKILQSNGYWVH